jgi:hypothetical protein
VRHGGQTADPQSAHRESLNKSSLTNAIFFAQRRCKSVKRHPLLTLQLDSSG